MLIVSLPVSEHWEQSGIGSKPAPSMQEFFQSEVVQKELTQMQELYMDINRMGLMLNVEQKREQLNKMLRLIDLQQTMYMRVTLSEDPEAKKLVKQVKMQQVC